MENNLQNTLPTKIKQIFNNKILIKLIICFLIFIVLIIINSVIKNNIYKTNSQSFLATTYANITNMPAIKVNKEIIRYTDYFKFYDYLNTFYKKQTLDNQEITTPNQESIKNEVVSKLVKNSVLQKLASKYDITVTDRELFDELKKLNIQTGSIDITEKYIKDNYNMSLDDFKKDFITPIIIKNKLNLVISNDNKINKTQIDKINNIYNQIKSSNNAVSVNKLGQKTDVFSTLAKESSEDKNSSENDGDLGWLSRDSMEESIKNAAFALEKGDYSQVIKSSSGYHIIKLIDKIDTIDIPKVRIAHIFVKTMDVDTYLQQEINNAKIKIYIK